MKIVWAALLIAASVWAQQPAAGDAEQEQRELRERLGEAGNSPVEFQRVLEKHLEKYPNTQQRAEIERMLIRAAIEQNDQRRILLYGPPVLAREPQDVRVLERVTRVLLNSDDKVAAERALGYAQQFEKVLRSDALPDKLKQGQLRDEYERLLSRSLLLQARATGNLEKLPEAVEVAQRAFSLYTYAEASREMARWLERSGKPLEAAERYAEAFTIPDERRTEDERAKDRARFGTLYAQARGTATGAGDLLLAAYDRTAALVKERQEKTKATNPNSQAKQVLDFTLTAVEGSPLALNSLKGKVVVLDFWATWCGPCRAQYPLYEQVKTKFKNREDVVFLAVNTDEDRTVVQPFLQAQKWTGKRAYFDDGVGQLLQVNSIPTTVVLDRKGDIVSRLNGFVPDRFVGMLTERIEEALAR